MMAAMATAKRLTDMVIDEVSFVDKAANQHSTVAFAKNDGATMEDQMPVLDEDIELYDLDGDEVDPSLLEAGDVVYAADGTELVYVEDDDDDDYDDDDEDFGKARGPAAGYGFSPENFGLGRMSRKNRKKAAKAREAGRAPRGPASGYGFDTHRDLIGGTRRTPPAPPAGPKGIASGYGFNTADLIGGKMSRGKKAALAAGGAAAVGGAGYAAHQRMKKSLGEEVLEELSKAANDDEREFVIAKAMDEVEIAKAQAAEAWEQVEEERDARLEMEFISKAAEYNLPIEDEDFGPILKRLVERMEPEDVEVIDQIFKSVGDALFNEVGYIGGGDNASIMDMVSAEADELVGKSDMTSAEAQVALMEANPELYDSYLAENGR